MLQPYEVLPDAFILPSEFPIPTFGMLSVNAYLVRSREPYLIDTGLTIESQAFMEALEMLIDPADLRWIYLTHDDPDHVGALTELLWRAPRARVVTTFIGFGKLALFRPLDPARTHLLNPGERLNVGDRELAVVRPPTFDAPETTAVYDPVLDALFCSDSFGTPQDAVHRYANDLDDETLGRGVRRWTAFDSPWIHDVRPERFAQRVDAIAAIDPKWMLGTHLPPARDMTQRLCEHLVDARNSPPYVGPTQSEFKAILERIGPTPEPPPVLH